MCQNAELLMPYKDKSAIERLQCVKNNVFLQMQLVRILCDGVHSLHQAC